MATVNLELFKKSVRVDFEEDDSYLEFLLESAEQSVVRSTNRTTSELSVLNDGEFPVMLKQAIIMLAAHWYNQREAVGGAQLTEVPYSIQALVKPWRRFGAESEETTETEDNDESGTHEDSADDNEAGDEEEQLG